MRIRTKITVCIALLSIAAHAGQEEWLTDFEKAKAAAREKNLPILANFAGSDWCGWCIKLNREVFSQNAFKAYAKTNLVLFLADFPAQKPQPQETAQQNKRLAQHFGIEGFPTVLLLDADGKELARTGYRPGGSKAYVDHLKHLIAGHKKRAPSPSPANATPTTTDPQAHQSDLPPASPVNQLERLFGEHGTLLALAAIFLMGLALNLTPCVYPMLSITVSIFGAQTDRRMARVFFKALVYVLGIATMYSLLGTMAALTGGLFGGLLQSPWVLATIGLLLAALALSMFGLCEIQLPAALMNRLGGATVAGLAGVYISGLVVGMFAAPCIGPPIIALLALVGAKGDPWFGFGSFFMLSLGLGAPYLILGTFSGLLKRLPRSGAWMVWVRKVFGVVLLGVAAFYFAMGFAPGLLQWIPASTLILGGLYLGFIERSANERKIFRRIKWAVAVLAVAIGAVLVTSAPHARLDWQPYHPDAPSAAKAARRPVVMDFYADWCIPCHELDRRTFTHPDVIKALADHVKLKVDLTRMDSPESKAAAEMFGIQGVPTVIFLDEDGRERPGTRVLGFLPPLEFIKRSALSHSADTPP